MQLEDKLAILADSAKYDVACTSSGVDRAGVHGKLGCSVAAGICHSFTPDGRCISLLKVLYSNACCYDCGYCVNRRSNDVPRATFTPRELAELTIGFYKRNYIEGLFLSSAVIGTPDYTMERMIEALRILRQEYHFNGYIHAKTIPGADAELVRRIGLLADRLSVNIELPSEASLSLLAPDKKKQAIFFSLLRKVFIVVPLTYFLPYGLHMGTDGVFMAEPVSNVIGGSLCFITMLVTILPELNKMGKSR
jgi:predicted DNA-binding helix-hairpin-helix protein